MYAHNKTGSMCPDDILQKLDMTDVIGFEALILIW